MYIINFRMAQSMREPKSNRNQPAMVEKSTVDFQLYLFAVFLPIHERTKGFKIRHRFAYSTLVLLALPHHCLDPSYSYTLRLHVNSFYHLYMSSCYPKAFAIPYFRIPKCSDELTRFLRPSGASVRSYF